MAPGTDADVLQLLDGPMAASGYHWYQAELSDGTTGWLIGEGLVPA